jgi:hypothetical protein
LAFHTPVSFNFCLVDKKKDKGHSLSQFNVSSSFWTLVFMLCLCEFKDCCKTTISLAKFHRNSTCFQDFRRWISLTTDYLMSFRGLWTSWIVSNTCEYAILMSLFLLSRVWLPRNCRKRTQSTI